MALFRNRGELTPAQKMADMREVFAFFLGMGVMAFFAWGFIPLIKLFASPGVGEPLP